MPKITRDIIESYIDCHYKAHLVLRDLGDAKPEEENRSAIAVAVRWPGKSEQAVKWNSA